MVVKTVLGEDRVQASTRALVKVDQSADGWSATWQDPVSGHRWQELSLNSGSHGGGVRALLPYPEPTPAQWIEVIRHSADTDEVVIAALRLADAPDFFAALLEVVHKLYNRGDYTRVQLVIHSSGIANGMNRRSPLGKHVREIERDALEFERIAESAASLLAATSHVAHD